MKRLVCSTILGFSGMAWAQPTTPPPAPSVTPRAAVKIASAGGVYLGVNVQEVDSDRAKALKLPEEAGVEITRITPDSPAEKAGLKMGDVILHYNGEKVEGMAQFSRLISETPAGREVKIELYRNGAPQTVMVKVGVRHEPNMMSYAMPAPAPHAFEMFMPDMPRSFMSWSNSMLGIVAESLDGQLAQFFGVKEGVLIRSVNSGSAAEKAGLKAGDVITKVDDSKVATPAEVSNRLHAMRGKPAAIVVMRDHKEVTLTLAIEDDHRAEWFQNHDGLMMWRDFGDGFPLMPPATAPPAGWLPNRPIFN